MSHTALRDYQLTLCAIRDFAPWATFFSLGSPAD